MYVFTLFNIKFLRSPAGRRLANLSFICKSSLFNDSALPCNSLGKEFFLILPFRKPKTLSK